MAEIIEFPGGRILFGAKPGDDYRGEALRPFWDLPKEWRCSRTELDARFDLETRIRIVRKTREKLANALKAQRKLGRGGAWYYDVNTHLNTARYLRRETAYLEELEELQRQARPARHNLAQIGDALCASMRGLMTPEPEAVS